MYLRTSITNRNEVNDEIRKKNTFWECFFLFNLDTVSLGSPLSKMLQIRIVSLMEEHKL
jgi:hypothetical protein